MILYFGIEYLRLSDAQRGTSILMTMTVRLAMHMGLHKDPSHYKELSIFECEMRRRLWTLVTEIDLLVSFQFGLPSNVQRRYFDTKLPRNLFDEDFDESTTEWPPERPLTESTPALYTIVKSRIVVAFGDILATVMSRDTPSYGEVLRLDKRLEEAYEAIPPLLKMRLFRLSITDPVDIIMQRLWIELMYQKARIVLHRRYFTVARRDNRYEYSHWACMNASVKILEHQFEIHHEMLPGGRLSKERWFLSSLSTHDFLLANMMLALELSFLLPKDGEEGGDTGMFDREKLLAMISTSRGIWQARSEESVEAARAFKILSRMLTIATGVQYEMVPRTAAVEAVAPSQRPSYQHAHGKYGVLQGVCDCEWLRWGMCRNEPPRLCGEALTPGLCGRRYPDGLVCRRPTVAGQCATRPTVAAQPGLLRGADARAGTHGRDGIWSGLGKSLLRPCCRGRPFGVAW